MNTRESARARKPQTKRRLNLDSLEDRTVPTGTWQTVAASGTPPAGTEALMLLSDGSVAAQVGVNSPTTTWTRLVPDSTGSYVNGTWTPMASMNLGRLFFPTAMLPDGRVFAIGGEYSTPNFTNTAEIYNPVTNTWTNVASFPQAQFGDDPIELLQNGQILAGYVVGAQTYRYNPSTNTWAATAGSKLRGDRSDEESWVKLPDGSILSYDIFASDSTGVFHAQRYVPTSDTWVDASNVNPANPPAIMSSNAVGFEAGPAILLPDHNRVVEFGANGNTAIYNISTGLWSAGPKLPTKIIGGVATQLGADDDPGSMLPNGHILVAISPINSPFTFPGPSYIYEFDPDAGTYTEITPATGMGNNAFVLNTVNLPTGQILLGNEFGLPQIYTPDGAAQDAWRPVITKISNNGAGTFTLTGMQLNGLGEGSNYGDDNESASNYPIVQLLDTSGNTRYARTFNWSSTGVATNNTIVTTNFTLPAGLNLNQVASFTVVANGIASLPTSTALTLNLTDPNITIRIDPTDSMNIQVLAGALVLRNYPNGSANPITIIGDANANRVTIDSSNGLVAASIYFDGGDGVNTVAFTQTGGATQTSDTFTPGPGSGEGTSIIVGGSGTQTLAFDNVTSVFDNLPATNDSVNGSTGDNGINYTAGPGGGIFVGNTGLVTVDNLATYEFNNKSLLTIGGQAGNDTINLNNATAPAGLNSPITVDGGNPTANGADTLIINANGIAETLEPSGTGAGLVTGLRTISFSGIESLQMVNSGNLRLGVDGTTGNDQLAYTPGATADTATVSGLMNAGASQFALIPVTLRNISSAGVALNAGPQIGGSDSTAFDGTAANNAVAVTNGGVSGGITLTDTVAGTTLANLNLVNMSGGVSVRGHGGLDTFTHDGSVPVPVAYAGSSTADILNFNGNGIFTTLNLAAQTVTNGTGLVSFSSLGTVNTNVNGSGLLMNGTAAPDTLTYTPTGASAGTVAAAGINTTFNFSNVLGDCTLDPLGGSNTVAINGTSSADAITATPTGVTTSIQVGALKTVRLVSADTQAVTVAGGGGDDMLMVNSATGPVTIPLTFDGGAGTNAVALTGGTATADTYTPASSLSTLTYVAGTESVQSVNTGPLFDAVAGPLTVVGTSGNNSIGYAVGYNSLANYRGGTTDSTWGQLGVDSFGPIDFTGKTTLTISALGGNDMIELNNASTPTSLTSIGVDGGNGTDTLVANSVGHNLVVEPTALGAGVVVAFGGGLPNAPFTGIEALQLVGSGGNPFGIDGTLGGDQFSYTPGATPDTGAVVGTMNSNGTAFPLVPVAFTNMNQVGGVVFNVFGQQGGTDTFVFNSPAANNVIQVNPGGIFGGLVLSDIANGALFANPNLANMSGLTVQGHGAVDTFLHIGATPIPVAYTGSTASTFTFIGDGTAAVTVDLSANTVAEAGFGTVSVSGIGTVNANAAGADLTIAGTASDDEMTVTPTGTSAATAVLAAGGPTINVSNVNTFTGDLLGGTNRLIVNGTNLGDSIDVSGTGVSVGTFKPVNYANVADLHVNGRSGDDKFLVTASPTTAIAIDGGDSGGLIPGDRLNLNVTLADNVTFFPGSDSDTGGFAINNNLPVSFTNIDSMSYQTQSAKLTPDPLLPGKQSLVLNGSDAQDFITIRPAATKGSTLLVTLNSGPSLLFDNVTGHIQVAGNNGNDVIYIDPKLKNPAIVDGGAGDDSITCGAGNDSITGGLGNDRIDGGKGFNTLVETGDVNMTLISGSTKANGGLTGLGTDVLVKTTIQAARLTGGPSANNLDASLFKGSVTLLGLGGADALVGGAKNDVLVGGDGDDSLVGGGGADVLIGGTGADQLDGGKGGDLLIAGNTSFDADITSLAAIQSEWTRAGTSYKVKMNHLTGIAAGGKNGAVILNDTTVFDDLVADNLIGGKGGGDWFFQSTGDVVNDLEKGETVTPIP
ncbi:MAG TPA: hypothetical protein VHR66_26380 [Gemmataceae bacterium]|jgi:Ca2+-binding RTX toxin-like protein|nr:hypothetical protein [Gemmataceae bacterium]